MTGRQWEVQSAMAAVTAYGRAVREKTPPEQLRASRDHVIATLAAAGVGQRYASQLEHYAAANRGQVDPAASPTAKVAAGRQAETLAAEIERAICTAMGIEPPPQAPATRARTGRQRPARGRG